MKLFLALCLLFIGNAVHSQTGYFQQELKYTIIASLDDKEKTITGKETINYKNNSASTLNFIWFHIYPNAYKNKSTALFQQLNAQKERSEKLKGAGLGSIEGLAFTVNGQPATTSPHPEPRYIDIIKLNLSSPLKPGDSITIATNFITRLPPYFSRSGYADGEFMACQWYPKPAVFDRNGWHEFPYLDMGEFYSEFAEYDVTITLPAAYIVSATGVLQTSSELEVYKNIGKKNNADREGSVEMYKAAAGSKSLNWKASQVPDFAWFADKNFVIHYDTIQLGSRTIDAFSFFHNKKKTIWKNSMDYIKDGTRHYSNWIGDYAYPVVQVVEGPKNNSSGGMEYPMVTLITSPDAKVESLDAVITHEIGHNWFMAMLGSNERKHTWMDEGMNSYFQFRYEAEKYRSNSVFGDAIPKAVKQLPEADFQDAIYNVINSNVPMDAAMDIPADSFATSEMYGIVSYVKSALWMHLLEKAVGREKVDAAFKLYFDRWKFKHPQPADMQAAFEASIGAKLGQFFELTKKEGKFE